MRARDRSDVLQELASLVLSTKPAQRIRVAVDGVDCSGKTTLADRLADLLRRHRPVVRASVDGFHLPRVQRYRRGRESPEGCYRDTFDLLALRERLLDPFAEGRPCESAVFDLTSDRPVSGSEVQPGPDAVLLVDGVFLQRPELAAVRRGVRAGGVGGRGHRQHGSDPAGSGATVAPAGVAGWHAGAMTHPSRRSPAARSLPALAAVAAGVVLILVVRSLTGGGSDGDATSAPGAPTTAESACEGPATELVLAVSPEKTSVLTEIAKRYAQEDGESDAGCVDVTVTEKSSGAAQTALARGWDERADGPRPDVWSPSSSSWPGLLSDALRNQDKPSLVPDGDLPSLVRTPLVIAMPKPMAEALGWPGKQPGWSDLLALSKDSKGWGKFGHPEWGPFRLGKTNPELSTSGLHALVGANFAATGLSSDLTAANINDPKVRAYVGGIEQSAVHYGPTTLTFLANQAKADRDGRGLTYVSAIAVEEKSLLDYNVGDPSVGGNGKPPQIPLAGIYPREGTVFSDNPYVTLTADWVDANKQAAAADFLEFATSGAAQKRFTDIGFRSSDGKAGALVSQKYGALPEQPKVELDPPAPPVLALIRDSWRDLRKKARVLFVIDRSGSMQSDNRIELARSAAAKAFDGFGPADQVGLATFSSDYRVDVPIAPVGKNLGALRAAAQGLFPEGGTALYASTRTAQDQMEREFQPGLINAVVVMTDGKNDDPDSDLERLLADLRPGEDTSRVIRVFTVAFGQDASLPELKSIADASTGASYDARNETSIEKVLSDVVSNF